MSSTLERLRRLHGLGQNSTKTRPSPNSQRTSLRNDPTKVDPAPALPSRQTGVGSAVEEMVAGQEISNEEGCCYLVTHAYELEEQRGSLLFGSLMKHDPALLSLFYGNFNLRRELDFAQAAFIDTETTGLGTGAGIYCFMVGVGRFEHLPGKRALGDQPHAPMAKARKPPTHFVVRQLFMRNPSEERALLVALDQLLADCTMTVTYNGRTFDLPLLRTRFQQNYPRFAATVPEKSLLHESEPHLDLLMPARRLWRRRLGNCRLSWLEQHLLGIERTPDDVPSHLIPHLYHDYVRTGDAQAGQLNSIFYHNREDVASLAILTSQVYGVFGHLQREEMQSSVSEVQSFNQLPGLDWLSLGCCYHAAGVVDRAECAYKLALQLLGNRPREFAGRLEGYRRLGELYKKQGAWEQAAEIWQQWLSIDPGLEPMPYIELAKYFEWRRGDLEQAEMWTRWALHNLQHAKRSGRNVQIMADLEHRLARITRKRRRSR